MLYCNQYFQGGIALMNNKYSIETKKMVIQKHDYGEKITDISKQFNVSRTTIYRWIKEHEKNKINHNQTVNMKMYRELERKYLRQKKIIQILQSSPCIVNSSLDVRIETIDKMVSEEFTINTLCEALCVSKATYYNRKLRGKHGYTEAMRKRDEIKPKIKELYDNSNQIYGPAKIHALLKREGYKVSLNVIASIMHDNNWFSIRGGAKTLYELNLSRKENILKQEFIVSRPNEVWVSDVTEVSFDGKRIFLCVIIDLFARKVIAYRISDKNNTPLTKKTFDMAYKAREPKEKLLFHSDQGSNYTSRTFRLFLKQKGVEQSFSRGGIPYDNSVCESFFGIYKQEEFYRTNYRSEMEVKKGINSFMNFYNTKRPHSLLRYRTPDDHEAAYFKKQADLETVETVHQWFK